MFVVCVHVHVRPDSREAFIEATRANAGSTILEPGNLRFDVLGQADDPHRFVLYEVYRDEAGAKAHKQTPHYAGWRDAVEPWMAEPRRGVQYQALFPDEASQWVTHREGSAGRLDPQQAAEEFAELARKGGGRSEEGFVLDRRDAHVRRADAPRADDQGKGDPR
jgi:autoinducer 2-degrading protein